MIFRVWRGDPATTLALFPELPANREPYCCLSFEHIGQHGAADYRLVLQKTRPARPQEYAELKQELEGRGYRLKIYHRETAAMREMRRRAIQPDRTPRRSTNVRY